MLHHLVIVAVFSGVLSNINTITKCINATRFRRQVHLCPLEAAIIRYPVWLFIYFYFLYLFLCARHIHFHSVKRSLIRNDIGEERAPGDCLTLEIISIALNKK